MTAQIKVLDTEEIAQKLGNAYDPVHVKQWQFQVEEWEGLDQFAPRLTVTMPEPHTDDFFNDWYQNWRIWVPLARLAQELECEMVGVTFPGRRCPATRAIAVLLVEN